MKLIPAKTPNYNGCGFLITGWGAFMYVFRRMSRRRYTAIISVLTFLINSLLFVKYNCDVKNQYRQPVILNKFSSCDLLTTRKGGQNYRCSNEEILKQSIQCVQLCLQFLGLLILNPNINLTYLKQVKTMKSLYGKS